MTTTIQTRRMSFEASLAEVPRHFAADGDLVPSHVAASLSAVFPDGEDYFVRSVRHFRDRITDPALRQQVSGFIGQEAMHGREHRAFNRRLAELGYPTRFLERVTERGLALADKVLPAKTNLAVTAALEHYTATLAEVLLGDDEVKRLFGRQEVLDLFLWHALEESEHKAVAFDVYRAVGGSEWMRRLVMNAVTAGFLGGMVLALTLSLLRDPDTYRPRRFFGSLRRMLASPVVSVKVWRDLRAYNRRGFHPSDHDASALLAEWRERLFGPEGSLTDRLATAA